MLNIAAQCWTLLHNAEHCCAMNSWTLLYIVVHCCRYIHRCAML
jgi:hypothetical protein